MQVKNLAQMLGNFDYKMIEANEFLNNSERNTLNLYFPID